MLIPLAVLAQLRVMREREPSAKALVFSQFATTIEWLKVKLQEQGFGYRTISGSMTLKQRSKVCVHIHSTASAPALHASLSVLPELLHLSAHTICPLWPRSPHLFFWEQLQEKVIKW